MSNVSNRHTVTPFVSGKSQPLTGQDLIVCSFKQTEKMTKAGIKALPSVCVSVPQFAEFTAEQLDLSRDLLKELFTAARRDIITAAYVKNQAIGSIEESALTVEACIEFLETKSGGRLTSESLGAWYDATMQPIVEAFTLEKLVSIGQLNADQTPTDKHMAIVESTVKDYREVFSALASGVTKYEEKRCTLLVKLLASVDAEDAGYTVARKLTARLTKMMQPVIKEARPDALALED